MDLLTACALVCAAYLLGSLSFAVLVSRAYRLPDPRTFGSGNPGATNMLRGGNRGAALWTLVGDTVKGMVAVVLAQGVLPPASGRDVVLAAVALAVFLGHLYPVFFRFAGGKGVATAAGILLALDWPLGIGTLLIWCLAFAVTRVSSVAALLSALVAPLLALVLLGRGPVSSAVLLMAALLIWRHRSNLRKLLVGEERPFRRR